MSLLDEVAVVVLDLDDTLYLERDYVRSGFQVVGQLTEGLGFGDIGEDLWALFEMGARNDTFDRALGDRGIAPDPELIQQLVQTYRTHSPDIELLDDAERLLARIDVKPTALITDGPAASQWAKISALGLDTRIGWCVVTADLGEGRSKPHPAAFERVERLSERTGRECVYISDNPNKDFDAPRALGWRSVRVRRPLSLHEGLETPAFVDREVTSLDDL